MRREKFFFLGEIREIASSLRVTTKLVAEAKADFLGGLLLWWKARLARG